MTDFTQMAVFDHTYYHHIIQLSIYAHNFIVTLLLLFPNSNYNIVMLHQLLLSLLGKPGAVIKQYDKQFKVDVSLSILTPSQANLINEIAQVGYYYAQIIKFIDYQLTQTSYADFKKDPSIYRKAMAQGLRKAVQQYEHLILGIQSDFLRNRYFTFSNIRAETTKYELILKEIWEIVLRITTEKYRGGVIIDILWEVYQKGNEWLKEWIALVLRQCQEVFINQVVAWIAHGQIIDIQHEFFIHKAIEEPQEKFKFVKTTGKNIQLTGWDIYTLDESLIPLSLINLQAAGKILFIGKSIKILRSSGKISSLPGKNILNDIKNIFSHQYSQISFESIIQKIRHSIAQEMIQLIIGQENLLKQLEKINSYYLMLKGDFYHHFLQQAKCVESIANKDRIQKKINETCLQNTFIRLNNLQDAKRVYYEIKPLGFQFHGFKNFINVCPVGNIDLVQGKFIRFTASGGAIWHRTKQIVQNNFTINYTLCFKKCKSVFKTRKDNEKDKSTNMISLVIQNSKDISPSLHQNPSSLSKISEYIAVNIGYRYNQVQKNYESLATIEYKNQKKIKNGEELYKHVFKKVNFLDETVYLVRLNYNDQDIKITINPLNSYDQTDTNSFKISSMKPSYYLSLEMNRANVGFISNISNFDCQAEIERWQMISKPTNHYGDIWSDLSLNLKMSWPINLILTPDLMQVFGRINKFLFPIRQIQIEMQQVFMKIPRRMKEQKRQAMHLNELRQYQIFERKLSSTRWRMNLTINNLWSYFQADVIQTAWPKLKQSILKSNDFQDVIRMINKYVNTIQTMYYFNALKIQRNIHDIIRECRNFVSLIFKMNAEIIDKRTYKEFQHIDDSFKSSLAQFYTLLKELSKTSNSSHLFHLTQRMEGCIEQERFNS